MERRGIEIEYVALIPRTFPVDHGHMKFTGGNQNDIAVARGINTALANILNIAFLQNDQLIIIVIMQVGRIGSVIVYRSTVGIRDRVIYDVIFPIHDFGIQSCLVFDIV
jgi:hypothetical protein